MGMPFFKAFSEGILRGSLADINNTTQLIWIKLLAMANETRDRDGYLRYAKGHPYTDKYIANVCHVTTDELEVAIRAFKNDIRDGIPRIQIAEDNSYFISNFKKYQDKPAKKPKEPMPENQKRGMIRSLVNQNPDVAIDTLRNDYGFTVVDLKSGEVQE